MLRNLHPEFRHFLESKDVRELDDILRFGLEFERRKELGTRYTPPPEISRAWIPAAAYDQAFPIRPRRKATMGARITRGR